MEIISVRKQTPTPFKSVLIWQGDNEGEWIVGFYSTNGKWYRCGAGSPVLTATHWAVLPTPPTDNQS